MIPINFQYNKKLLDEYYDLVVVKNHLKKNIDKLDEWCKKYLIFYIKGKREVFSFMDVVEASPERLICIARRIRILKRHNIEGAPYEWNKNKRKSYYIVNNLYNRMSHESRKKIIDSLGIVTCPYCNRNYINDAESHSGCHLDHFYDKKTYPILAVSFYNLIPVCSTCNEVKANRKLYYSPHNSVYKADDLLQFSYIYKTSPGEIQILLKPKVGAEFYKKNIEVLELEKLYQIHSEIVNEIIQKASYVKQYKKAMYRSLKIRFTNEEIMRQFLGNYYTEDLYGKRPLAKLTHDIAKEVHIIK